MTAISWAQADTAGAAGAADPAMNAEPGATDAESDVDEAMDADAMESLPMLGDQAALSSLR